jgi:C-terminal binding protein
MILKPWSSIEKELRDKVQGITMLKLGFTAEDLDLFPNLRVQVSDINSRNRGANISSVVRMGVGYDRVDRIALKQRGVILCNIPDYGTSEIADHTLALALSLRRGIVLHHDMQRANPPAQWSYIASPLVSRIQKQTFGIIGLGRIGIATALRAKAFGWNVLFYDPYLPNGIDRSLGIERVRDVEELFRRSTTLSLHCPATKETIGMVNYDLLSLMPIGAILVNTSRGEIMDLDGLERSLKEGTLAGVGLDVLPDEPISFENVHPLIQAYRNKEDWLTGRMILTPHSAWYTEAGFGDIRLKTAETMRDVLIDGLQTNVIQPPFT